MSATVSARVGPDVDLMYLLAQATHVLSARVGVALDEVGISQRTYCVLRKALSGQHTQIKLAEFTLLDKTTMVATIDELQRAGLAERRPSATDRRARIVAVTDAGRAKLTAADTLVRQVYDDVLGSLPAKDRDRLLASLHHLVTGPLASPPQCQSPPRRPRASRTV